MMCKLLLAAAIAAVILVPAAQAANPPVKAPDRNAPTTNADYVPLGTSPFGPNGHGAYAWFVDVKNQQVVMCLVHNPQAEIECKRTPMPAVTTTASSPPAQ